MDLAGAGIPPDTALGWPHDKIILAWETWQKKHLDEAADNMSRTRAAVNADKASYGKLLRAMTKDR